MIEFCNNILRLVLTLAIVFCSIFASAGEEIIKSESKEIIKSTQDSKSGLDQKNEQVKHQKQRVLIYKHSDSKCDDVKSELKKHNIEYQDIDLTWNHKQKIILQRKAGKEDSSYVFIGNEYIGNHDDLLNLLKHGKLLRALQGDD